MWRRNLSPRGVRRALATAEQSARCSHSSNFLSAAQAASVALPFSGRGKKLLPFSANEPRLLPSILRRATYFQYAACSASSQMLCRPGPGRHAACTTETPLRDCFRFGPCHVFFSYASSSRASNNFAVCVFVGLTLPSLGGSSIPFSVVSYWWRFMRHAPVRDRVHGSPDAGS